MWGDTRLPGWSGKCEAVKGFDQEVWETEEDEWWKWWEREH